MSLGHGTRNERKFYYLQNSEQVREFVRCQQDPIHFINTHVKIPHPMKGKIPFKLFGFQIALLRVYCLYKFNVTLKPRQMGISTLVCAYVLWLTLFHPMKVASMISIKESIAKNLLRKIKFMYTNLPDYFKMEVTNGGVGVGAAERIAWANGSEINAEAATKNAGRSEALSCLVMDEVAFQMYASDIWASAQPTLSTGGQAILLSTAFGVGNLFHSTYIDAIQNLNGFHPVRLKWQMHPERTEAWYLEQLRAIGKKRVAQEVDCDFLQSGFNVFDMGKIKAIEERLNSTNPIRELENGLLKIYHEYDPKHQFFLGADIASGRARDFSAFSIFDETGKEYGCYKGKIGIRDFGHLMMKTGNTFGQAVLAPESNAIGEGVIATLQENNYPNIYNNVSKVLKLDSYEKEESVVYGWMTTGKSRHEIITNMDDDLTQELVELNNPYFIEEAYTFVYSAMNNKPIALGKDQGRTTSNTMYEDENKGGVYTDDAILGSCIGNEVRKAPVKYKGALPFV